MGTDCVPVYCADNLHSARWSHRQSSCIIHIYAYTTENGLCVVRLIKLADYDVSFNAETAGRRGTSYISCAHGAHWGVNIDVRVVDYGASFTLPRQEVGVHFSCRLKVV